VVAHTLHAAAGQPVRVSFDSSSQTTAPTVGEATEITPAASAAAAHGTDLVLASASQVQAISLLTGFRRWGPIDVDRLAGKPVIVGDNVYVTRYWTETTYGSGRSGSPQVSSHAAIVTIDGQKGEVKDEARFTTASILDSDRERVLYLGDSTLYVAERGERGRAIPIDRRQWADGPDWTSARLGGGGLVVITDEGRTLRSIDLDGQLAWEHRIEGGIVRMVPRGDEVFVISGAERVLALTSGDVRWQAPLPRNLRVRFSQFEDRGMLLFDSSGHGVHVDTNTGAVREEVLPIGDLAVLTGIEPLSSGRMLLVIAGHRVAVLNRASQRIEWHYDSPDAVVWAGAAQGVVAIAAGSSVAKLALANRTAIVGWVESVDLVTSEIAIRTAAPEIRAGRLAAYPFADYRTKRADATPTDLVVPQTKMVKDGLVRVPAGRRDHRRRLRARRCSGRRARLDRRIIRMSGFLSRERPHGGEA